MESTKLSSKGQIVLPKAVREALGWGPGTEFTIEATADGVTLRAKSPFRRTHVHDVIGSVRYTGSSRTLEEMEAGIRRAVARRFRQAVER